MTPPSSPQPGPYTLQIHPLLQPNRAGQGSIMYNVNYAPLFSGHHRIQLPAGYNADGLNQPATHPPMGHLRFTCHVFARNGSMFFPWFFDVHSEHPSQPLTVMNVLAGVYQTLRRSVNETEYFHFDETQRQIAHHTSAHRNQAHQASSSSATTCVRADFLGDSCYFAGIVAAADGSLALRLTSPPGL